MLSPAWNVPSPKSIGGELLVCTYVETMEGVFKHISKARGGVVGNDGATNRHRKSVSNVIVHTHKTISYLRADLQRETTVIVVKKVADINNRLNKKTGVRSTFAFLNYSCKGMRDIRRILVTKRLVKWEYGCAYH